jgi:hypothetical protein
MSDRLNFLTTRELAAELRKTSFYGSAAVTHEVDTERATRVENATL